jgi:hypothetical protein
MNVASAENVFWALISPIVYGFICVRINRAAFSPILLAAFVVGFITSYVAYLMEVLLTYAEPQHVLSWLASIALVALPEETVKLAALVGLSGKSAKHPVLMVACFIGCGFAASENVVYLQRFGEGVIAARFLTATAFHVFNAIIMARILVTTTVLDGALRIVLALIVPVLLHGTYDFLLMQSPYDGGRFAFVLCFTIAAGLTTLRAHRHLDKLESQ